MRLDQKVARRKTVSYPEGKQSLLYEGNNYSWEIKFDSEINCKVLKVHSNENDLECYYSLFATHDDKRYMLVTGDLFGGEFKKNQKYLCPQFENVDWSIDDECC